jgi:hypothetical protein
MLMVSMQHWIGETDICIAASKNALLIMQKYKLKPTIIRNVITADISRNSNNITGLQLCLLETSCRGACM